MKTIKYILVNETSSENAVRAIRDCHLPDIGYNHIVEACNLSKSELIGQLCRLRRHYPNAKILGISELGEHGVQPNGTMNRVRREMSDLQNEHG